MNGQRVNDSVFEVTLTQTRHKELLAKITKLIKRQEDSVRIYPVCNNCLPKIKTLGDFDPLPFILADTFI
ncbi:MAG: CRISPR-associated endonuclease Cas2 [Campylobacterales bacterium]